jgi:hypothetical protein
LGGTARGRCGPFPIDWAHGVACLDPNRPPNDVPRHRWRQFVADCKNFFSSPKKWAERAARLRWDRMALFGCAPKSVVRPSGRSTIPVAPASYGLSTAADCLNYIEIGQSSNWLRTDRGASSNVGASTQGTSRWLGLPDHSALMLRARMTLPHFSVSSAMYFPKPAGEPTSAVPPKSASRAFALGLAELAISRSTQWFPARR